MDLPGKVGSTVEVQKLWGWDPQNGEDGCGGYSKHIFTNDL